MTKEEYISLTERTKRYSSLLKSTETLEIEMRQLDYLIKNLEHHEDWDIELSIRIGGSFVGVTKPDKELIEKVTDVIISRNSKLIVQYLKEMNAV